MRHRQVLRYLGMLENVVTARDPILDPARLLQLPDQLTAFHGGYYTYQSGLSIFAAGTALLGSSGGGRLRALPDQPLLLETGDDALQLLVQLQRRLRSEDQPAGGGAPHCWLLTGTLTGETGDSHIHPQGLAIEDHLLAMVRKSLCNVATSHLHEFSFSHVQLNLGVVSCKLAIDCRVCALEPEDSKALRY